jgi:hypothetical protein
MGRIVAVLATTLCLVPAGAQGDNAPVPAEPPAGMGLLHVFNDSGPTLLREITPEQAATLMAEFERRGPDVAPAR